MCLLRSERAVFVSSFCTKKWTDFAKTLILGYVLFAKLDKMTTPLTMQLHQ
jgi:hypothetical protein